MRLPRTGPLVVLACALAWGAPAAQAVIPSGNLVVNPGAEDGPGAPDSSTVAPPPGWLGSPGFTAVAYGASGYPTPDDSRALGGGANFFAGGNEASTVGTQNLDVSAAAAEIDAGGVVASASALLGGFASQADSARVLVIFSDPSGACLGVLGAGPVTAAERGGITGLQARSTTAGVPAGTRTIILTLVHTRSDGSYNDGYADNVSLTLAAGSAAPANCTGGGGGGGGGGAIGGPTADPPVRGTSVQLREIRGSVTVLLPGAGAGRLLRGGEAFAELSQAGFVPLNQVANIPVGSIVNATRGTARLTVAESAAALREVTVSAGRFQIVQSRRGRPITEMALQDTTFAARCTPRSRAGIAQSRRTVNRLRTSTRGRRGQFRTRGRVSSATVRGTDWTTTDRCDGTLTTVRRGTVVVRDFLRRRSITVRAGQRYLASIRPR